MRRLVLCRSHEAAGSAWRYERPADLKATLSPAWAWEHADGSITRFASLDRAADLRGIRFDDVEYRTAVTAEQTAWIRANLMEPAAAVAAGTVH